MPFKSDSVPFGLPRSKLITVPLFTVIGVSDVKALFFCEAVAVMLCLSGSLAKVLLV